MRSLPAHRSSLRRSRIRIRVGGYIYFGMIVHVSLDGLDPVLRLRTVRGPSDGCCHWAASSKPVQTWPSQNRLDGERANLRCGEKVFRLRRLNLRCTAVPGTWFPSTFFFSSYDRPSLTNIRTCSDVSVAKQTAFPSEPGVSKILHLG